MPADHFDLLAPLYDRAIRLKNPEGWLTIARLPATGTLLDAGGGTGRIATALRSYVNKAIVVDLSFGMLKQAIQKNDLDCVCAPSERLPFDDNTFERVIMVDAFHHIIDQKSTTSELWRVLKPAGRLVIEEPDIRNAVVKLIAVIEKLALMRSHFISPPRIAQLFSYPNSQVVIFRKGYNSWVIADKK